MAAGQCAPTVGNILLLDQVTRSIFRGTAKAFSGDEMAIKLAKQLLPTIHCYPVYEQYFILMPLMNSEDPNDGYLCIVNIQCMKDRAVQSCMDAKIVEDIDKFTLSAKGLNEITKKWRRFPARNKALMRENTPGEEEYLKTK